MTRFLLNWLYALPLPTFRPARPRRQRGRWQSLEALEQRVLLSGNVTADLVDGKGVLKGDGENNSIQIGIEDGNLVLTGLDGTTINGEESLVVLTGETSATGDLRVNLGRGDDSLFISDGIELNGNVRIRDTQGSNFFGVRGATLNGNLVVVNGKGNDTVSLEETNITGSALFRTGRGRDLVSTLQTTIGGKVKANMGADIDSVMFDESQLGDKLRVRGGRDADNVVLRKTDVADKVVAALGHDNDFLMVQDVNLNGKVRVRAGSGNDTIVSDGENNIAGDVNVNGGVGKDDAISTSEETAISGSITARHFESDTVDEDFVDNKLNAVVTLAENARDDVTDAIGGLEPELTTDTSSNDNTTESNGTLLTRESDFVITGTTGAGNTIRVDADGDGQFDDGTTTADEDGEYSVSVPLGEGQQAVKVQAENDDEETTEETIDVYRAVGTVVRFATPQGNFDVELFDEDAPETVANFLSYLDSYDGSIIHRSTDPDVEGLSVIQGGGFVVEGETLTPITTHDPVANEFDPTHSNVRGTLALALPAGDINGGTSQWFINVEDNSSIDSGKYTVFGQVIGTGMDSIDTIHDLPTYNLNPLYPSGGGALNTVPLNGYVPLAEDLSGEVAVTEGSTHVLGNETAFTTELAVGQRISIGGQIRTVASIENDTSLEVTEAFTETSADAAPMADGKPLEEEFVRFTTISEILPVA